MRWIDEGVREFAVPQAARPCRRRPVIQSPISRPRPVATGTTTRGPFGGVPLDANYTVRGCLTRGSRYPRGFDRNGSDRNLVCIGADAGYG